MPNTLTENFVQECSWKPDLFKGKACFITGGSGTICRVQAEAFALLGGQVAIVGREVDRGFEVRDEINELCQDPNRCISLGGIDVRDYKQLEEAVKQTVEAFGRIDFVVAGAAGNFVCDFVNLSPNAFKSVVDIDLLGSFNTVKAALPELIKTKGSILFISSTLHKYGVPFQGPVGAAKSGIEALSNNLSVELGPFGIRSNCIQPGAIEETEGFQRLSQGRFLNEWIRSIPLQRFGTKRDIAEATIFLFSSAGAYINGEIITVDGAMWHTGTVFTHREMYPKVIEDNMSKFKAKAKL